jgi:RND family efflux transporter MFP subunit
MTGIRVVPARRGCHPTPEYLPMRIDFPRKRSTLFAFTAIVLAGLVVTTGLISRRSQAEQLKDAAAARMVPTVSLLSPSSVAPTALELPARVEAWSRAPIYARVSGYLQGWKADIGTPVKAGQLLAKIEIPDLDQQLLQARAELATARSNLALSTTTAKRWQGLLADGAVSRQETDEKAGDLASRQSQVQALRANVERITALQGYTRLVAPFDGIVTARNTDVGALINVGGAPGSELFVVSDIRRLRVYVRVPQRQVTSVRPGSTAQLTVPERPGQVYAATVQSLAQAISPDSGTMLVQLAVDNKAGELLPGAYGTVRFEMPALDNSVNVPPGALILGKNGVQVAIVDGASRIRLKRVTVARDLGNVVQLAAGVQPGDRIVDSPPDGIADGDLVRINDAPRQAAP